MNRLKLVFSICCLFYIFLLVAGCSFKPRKLPRFPKYIGAKHSIRVISSDPIVRSQVCLALHQTSLFSKIICEDSYSLKTDYTLSVEALIHGSSLDYAENARISLLTLGTLLLVSSSADIDYHFELFHQNRKIDRFNFRSRGRVGMWAVLPVLMGFFGTSFGTFFNWDGHPEKLKQLCLAKDDNPDYSEKICRLYKEFQQDGLAQVWEKIRQRTKNRVTAFKFKQKESRDELPGAELDPAGPSLGVTEPSQLVCTNCRLKPLSKENSFDLVLYSGQVVREVFGEIMTGHEIHYQDSRLSAVGLNYKFLSFIQRITFETEGLIVKHDGLQDHWETDVMLIARIEFWKDMLPISFAFGKGLSYASEMPSIEGDTEDDPTNQWLNFFIVEMDVGLKNIPWNPRLLFRIHHRSGVGGIYCPKTCGSNFLTSGIKVSF